MVISPFVFYNKQVKEKVSITRRYSSTWPPHFDWEAERNGKVIARGTSSVSEQEARVQAKRALGERKGSR